jgi:hypothetical protein
VPPSLDAALARALAKQPDARYPSASAFADALAAAGVSLADPPVSAPAAGRPPVTPAPGEAAAPTPRAGGGPPSSGSVWSATPRTGPAVVTDPAHTVRRPAAGRPPVDPPAGPGRQPDWRSDRWVDPPPPYVEVSPTSGPPPASAFGPRGPDPVARPLSFMTPPSSPAGASTRSAPGRGDGPPPAVAVPPAGPPPLAGGETIVPEHRRVARPPGSGSGVEPEPGSSTAVRVLLIGAAVVVVGVALGLGGVALRLGQSPPATATEPSTVPVGPASPPAGPVAPGTTVSPGAAVARPRIDALEPVPGGLHVAWKDDGMADAKGYGYQVTVDGGRPFTGTADRRDDGSLRLSQEILTLKAEGRTERVDPAAHTYCVTIRRLQLGGPVDSDPLCTPPR